MFAAPNQLATLSTVVATVQPTASIVSPTGGWKLVWGDEFTGTTLDTTKWANTAAAWGNSMNSVTTDPANITVSGGVLTLTLASHTSGATIMSSNGPTAGYTFTNNEIVLETRTLYPGDGTHIYNWSSFWCTGFPSNSSIWEETDLTETIGGALNTNYNDSNSAKDARVYNFPYNGGAWHTYTWHHNAGTGTVYYDGTQVATYTYSNYGNPQSIIITIGTNATYGGPEQTGPTGAMQTDYVRVWTPR